MLFYQDFNEQFEGYTQRRVPRSNTAQSCFIRISMNNLKDIHNLAMPWACATGGCFIRISMNNLKDIHNYWNNLRSCNKLFYQDFNEQFEGYTQQRWGLATKKAVVLSGFQWTIWRIYTTRLIHIKLATLLFYQDFNEQFEGYTQLADDCSHRILRCFIRISMNNLKDIHNNLYMIE